MTGTLAALTSGMKQYDDITWAALESICNSGTYSVPAIAEQLGTVSDEGGWFRIQLDSYWAEQLGTEVLGLWQLSNGYWSVEC